MDKGLKDLINELREYAAPRRGELAGMLLEAANRLEEQGQILETHKRIDLETQPGTVEGLYNQGEISLKLRNVIHGHFYMARRPKLCSVELIELSKYAEKALLRWRGMGPALLDELRAVMHKNGLTFFGEEDSDDM